MTDRTMVTGTPSRASTPLRGQVIAERYEIRAQLRNDVFSLGMLAFDQETEDRVVLRIVRPELLDATARAEAYRALRKASGTGGRFLPGLLDVDKDGEYVFAVEPVPEGASLRDVLDARIARDQPMSERELLPLVSHMETALAAVPPPLRHGDVRADHVWVDPHRLWLLGAFVVPALPVGAVAALLQKDSGLRRRMAPEVLRGIASDAADRYGVGAIVYEAMTLQTPPEPGEAGDLPPTPVGEEVRALIHPDPGLRAKSLEPLVEALSKASGLAVPELDPGTFRAPKRLSVPRAGSVRPARKPSPAPPSATEPNALVDTGDTQQMPAVSAKAADALLDSETAPGSPRSHRAKDDDGLPPPPTVSEEALTRQFPLDEAESDSDEESASETAKVTPLSKKRAKEELEKRMKSAGLDPRLVRAALDRSASAGHVDEQADDGPPSEEPDSIDPRLVRAALGIERIDADEDDDEVPLDPSVPAKPAQDGTQELRLDDLEVEEEDDEVPLDPSVPAKPAQDGTQELRLDDLEVEEEDDEVPLDPSVPAEPAQDGTQELRLDDLEMEVDDAGEQVAMRAPQAPARDMGLADLEEMARRRKAVPMDGIQPIPRPRKDSLVGVKGPVLFDDSSGPKPQPYAPAPQPQAHAAHAPAQPHPQAQAASLAAPRAPRLEPDAAVIVKPASEPPRRPSRPTERPMAPKKERNWGTIIIVVSLLLGAAIIIGSFAYARYQKTQAEEERRQRIQDRIERMRGGAE